MKKRVFIAMLAAAAIVAGCDKSDTPDALAPYEPSTIPISFQTEDNWGDDEQTKAATDLTTSSSTMAVFASFTPEGAAEPTSTPNFMMNQLVTYDGTSSWSYTPTRYWPKSGSLAFFGYAPHRTNGAEISYSEENLTINFNAATEAGATDLLIARYATHENNHVEFRYYHALNSISLVGMTENADITRKLTAVRFTGVETKGSVDLVSLGLSLSGESGEIANSCDVTIDNSSFAQIIEQPIYMLPQELGSDAQIELDVEVSQTYYDYDIGDFVDAPVTRTFIFSLAGTTWSESKQTNYSFLFTAAGGVTLSVNDWNKDDPTTEDYYDTSITIEGYEQQQPVVDDFGANLSYDFTEYESSNCYMLHPSTTEQVFYIPIEERINTYWSEYDNQAANQIGDVNDVWTAEVLWYSTDLGTNNITCERVTSGYYADCPSAMKVTLPANSGEGNLLVAVKKGTTTLWSWHLWITDYNPDAIAKANQGEIVAEKYKYTDGSGSGVDAVNRYDDGSEVTVWGNGGEYAGAFIMDRNIGDMGTAFSESGGITYQYGRKDPLCSSYGTTTTSSATMSKSVNNPNIRYDAGWNYNWCSDVADAQSHNWHDEKLGKNEGKSIFDPSPLGWKVPCADTWRGLNTTNTPYGANVTNYRVYNEAAIFNFTGFFGGENNSGESCWWSNELASSASPYNMQMKNDGALNTKRSVVGASYTFCVRCVQDL